MPAQYRKAGAHDHGAYPVFGPVELDPVCLPIAELIGTDPTVRQDEHPQARVTFTKSHFGPELSETVIDYGDEPAAVRQLRKIEMAVDQCVRYQQSTAKAGANIYRVGPLADLGRLRNLGDAVTAMRLDAIGPDFPKVFWYVVVVRSDSRIAAIGFLTFIDSVTTDLRRAVPVAVAKLRRT